MYEYEYSYVIVDDFFSFSRLRHEVVLSVRLLLMTTQKRKSIPAGIVDGNKTRRDRSIGRTKINRMVIKFYLYRFYVSSFNLVDVFVLFQESVNDAVTGALLQVFKNKLYVPLYPFKTIVQYLLREEASEGTIYHPHRSFISLIFVPRLFTLSVCSRFSRRDRLCQHTF